MIQHLVLFKLYPDVRRDDPRLAEVLMAMDALPAQIPAIRSWQHGFNVTDDPQDGDYFPTEAWDYALNAVFDDEAALQAYFDDPAHLPVVEAWEQIANLAYCDMVLKEVS